MNGEFLVAFSDQVRQQIDVETLLADLDGERPEFTSALAYALARLAVSPLDFGNEVQFLPVVNAFVRQADIAPVRIEFTPVPQHHVVFVRSITYVATPP